MKATRLTNGKRLHNGLKSHGGRIIFFSDEKNWTVDRSYNVQNDRWLAEEREEVPAVFTTKFPASVMTLGVICSTGEVMSPFFFSPKERVNAERTTNLFNSHGITFWDRNTWPSNSPDLHPCDYYW
ncbi:Uncharacterized protein FKW44_005818 [Caligus rogercresseyi]|uniref:Transposable element Tc3 transposase n=1 Tax=Caligus rogercresseyi TaxID=217165 RepID=A0A7T8QSC2_CALRO|nr:Uncharacterized protein FKW44_024765 [Caligus rogercresseyi]QQP33112.1 Uncharacterized protein FKW44_024369 [Caligus rogercresseyi]QQP53358.1 Uncharacterized protein FKW44_005818 [Caligus rogercresseyi]